MKGAQFTYFRKDLFRTTQLAWKAGKRMAVTNIVIQGIQALLPVVSLYFIKWLVELIAKGNKSDLHDIISAIIGLTVAQLLTAAAGQYSAYINTLQQQKISDYVAEMVLHKAVHVNLEYYENPDYHNNLHIAQVQSQYRIPQLVGNMNAMLLNSFSLVFLAGFFLTLQWMYALLFLLLSVPLAAIKWYYSYQLYRLEKKFIPTEREAGYLHQVLTSASYAKEVRIFGFAGDFITRFRKIRSSIYEGKKAINIRLNRYSILTQIAEAVVMAAIFISLGRSAWEGSISLGVFVIYIQGFQRLQSASKNFLQSFVQIFQQRLFLKDLFRFFDIAPQTKERQAAFPALSKGLAIKNVSFTYPGTAQPVLHNVSIDCTPGKVIAIVGENGSGKSTLVKLLAGLYELQNGAITLDGLATNAISDEAFRSNTFFLFQDFEHYFFTVAENIQLAGGGDTDRNKAAALAGADEYINKLPKGYETRLGRMFDDSQELSGGQWQKLAIARMFYKNAQLVVLDEPTSSVDAIAEHELFDNLKQHAAGKMIILITHTLYNLKIADHIYVMEDGRIAEEGSFDELTVKNGIFKRMFDSQKI